MILYLILTNAPLPLDNRPQLKSLCGNCTLCVKACPTNAISDEGARTARALLRNYMLTSGSVPMDMREKLQNRFLGCEICQKSMSKEQTGNTSGPAAAR